MAGASPEHNRISGNLVMALGPTARDRRCHYGAADQRTRSFDRSYVYPDFVLACDSPAYSSDKPSILENPTFVTEIASDSTEAADRGRKLTAYTALDSVQEYWTVASDVAEVTTFVRSGDGWKIGRVAGLSALARCETLGLDVALDDVYALVTVSEADPYSR